MTTCSWKFADRITEGEWSLECQGEPFAAALAQAGILAVRVPVLFLEQRAEAWTWGTGTSIERNCNHQKLIVSYSRNLFTLLYTHCRPTSARAGLAIACCVE